MPEVSVIIPNYNRITFLERAIRSVLSQTRTDLDIWVVQNGGFTTAGSIVKNLQASTGIKIHYITLSAASAARARNEGLRLSQGKYLAFLDDDDVWMPEKLEKQAAYLDQHPECGMVFSPARAIDLAGQEVPVKQSKELQPGFQTFFEEGCVIRSFSGVLFRRKCFEVVGSMDARYPITTDYDFYLRFLESFKIHQLAEPLYWYQCHSGNLSQSAVAMHREIRSILSSQKKNSGRYFSREDLMRARQRIDRRLLAEGVNFLETGKYRSAAACIFDALIHDPAVGLRAQWNEQEASWHSFMRPYVLFLRAVWHARTPCEAGRN